jgi:hypothetical protein
MFSTMWEVCVTTTECLQMAWNIKVLHMKKESTATNEDNIECAHDMVL